MVNKIIDILNGLSAVSKLERDRSEIKLIDEIKNTSDYRVIFVWIEVKLKEEKSLANSLGCLTGIKVLLMNGRELPHDYLHNLSNQCIFFQQDNEYRVRMLAGECMGELCRLLGVTLFTEYSSYIRQGIVANLEHQLTKSDSSLPEKYKKYDIIYESVGWQLLETWLRCFQYIINGLGISIEDVFDQEIIDIILEAVVDTSRFVRESGYELIGTVAEKNGFVKDTKNYLLVCKQLKIGLSDNWSQVRMAASIATRKILLSTKPAYIEEHDVFKILLPGICLNRYYVADGVKIFNQDTWRMVVGDLGKELIEENIEETIKFYIEQSGVNNHGVREAACSSISEIVVKLNQEKIRPYLNQLLDALILCFSDDFSSVRDVACVASGRLVSTFPNETKVHYKDVLMPLFLNNVVDNLSSVREGGAYSVACVINTFISDDIDLLKGVLDFIYINLENLRNEKENSSSTERLDKGCFIFNDVDKQVDLCKTMNTKMIKARQSELWEKADGCILLIGELSLQVKESHIHMPRLIPAVITALNYRHYPHYVYLFTTTFNIMTKLYQGLGKQVFKQYLNDFLGLLDVGINSNSSIVVTAAEDTFRFLRDKLGPNILKGRIEMYSMELLERTNRLFVN